MIPNPIANQKLTNLSLFFPARNEEGTITESVKQADEIAQTITSDYEIIVINDGSTDKTAQIVNDLTLQYPKLKLVSHAVNEGYGQALHSGFEAATRDWIFFTDADLQFDLNEIKKLIKFTNQYDVIIGYRQNRRDPFFRSVNTWGWKIINRLIFGLEVKDIDCAFKLIKASAIKPILPKLISGGAMVSAEFLIRLKQAGFEFKEIAVSHYPRRAGASSGAQFKVILRAFKELIQVFLEMHNT